MHTHTHKASLQKTLKECVLDRLTSAGLLEMVTPFSLGMLAELLGELGPEPGALLQAESRVHKDRDVFMGKKSLISPTGGYFLWVKCVCVCVCQKSQSFTCTKQNQTGSNPKPYQPCPENASWQ